MGGSRAHFGAPDQRCPLSRKRTYQRIPIPITFALAGAVMFTTALASTTTGNAARITGAGRPDRAPVAAVALAAFAAPRAAAAPSAPQARPPLRTPRRIAKAMLVHRFGWKAWQFKYLNRLWAIESGWNRYASNPSSGAYGIPQAVPGSKMSSAGPGWQWNARTQIRWGMRYIQARYRTPYWAWRQQHAYGWY
jgi:hypothetical protein